MGNKSSTSVGYNTYHNVTSSENKSNELNGLQGSQDPDVQLIDHKDSPIDPEKDVKNTPYTFEQFMNFFQHLNFPL